MNDLDGSAIYKLRYYNLTATPELDGDKAQVIEWSNGMVW